MPFTFFICFEGTVVSFIGGLLIGVTFAISNYFESPNVHSSQVGFLLKNLGHRLTKRMFFILYFQGWLIILGGIGGIFGSLVDSLLGATFQFSGSTNSLLINVTLLIILWLFSGIKESDNSIVHKRGEGVRHICGIDVLDNHSVNLLSNLITALVLPILGQLFFIS